MWGRSAELRSIPVRLHRAVPESERICLARRVPGQTEGSDESLRAVRAEYHLVTCLEGAEPWPKRSEQRPRRGYRAEPFEILARRHLPSCQLLPYSLQLFRLHQVEVAPSLHTNELQYPQELEIDIPRILPTLFCSCPRATNSWPCPLFQEQCFLYAPAVTELRDLRQYRILRTCPRTLALYTLRVQALHCHIR